MEDFDIEGARKAGYSEAEIAKHLAELRGFDMAAAKAAGYDEREIISHLTGGIPAPEKDATSTLTNPAISGVLGAGAGAAYSAKALPIKAASALSNALERTSAPAPTPTPAPPSYTTPAGINVAQTPGGLHPGAVGNAQFNVEQQQANKLHQNVPEGYKLEGTSRIITPVGMAEPTAASTAPRGTQSMSTVNRLRKEGWPIVREATEAAKSAAPVVGGALRNVATSNPVAGAMAGYNAQDALNRYRAGDTTGAAIGGAGTVASLLPKMKGKAGLIKPVVGMGAAGINALRGEPESVMAQAAGGQVKPILHKMAGGGKAGMLLEGIKAARNIAGFTPQETKILRASEALAPHEGKHLNVTQSDRMRSTEGDLGGPGFSRFQGVDPRYAEANAAWGVGKKPTASAIVNVNKRFPEGQAVWSPMIGSETQHHSNQHVFDMLSNEFNRQAGAGKLTPELQQRINQRLQSAPAYKGRFDPSFDIANPEMLAEAGKTFDRRGALAEVMSGQGVGGAKGSIIDYPGIMQEMTDPMTIGAPTHSIGTRLFELSGGVSHRPDLHSAFPYILEGKDMGVAFNPVPKELALRDWMQNFKDFKGRSPGYYDMTRTTPNQFISEDYLRALEDAGHSEGGSIHTMAKGGKLRGGLTNLPMAQRSDMREMGQIMDARGGAGLANELAKQAYNHPATQGAMFASQFASPAMAIGMMGKDVINDIGEGDYAGAGINAGLNALPFAKPMYQGAKKGVSALRGMFDGAERSVMPAMAPAMAGGGAAIKALAKKLSGGLDELAPTARPLPGDPYNAQGPWMRDYQPAEKAAPKIAYMGKYLSPTPERMAAQKAEMNADIQNAIAERKHQYILGLRESGMTPEEIAEDIAGPHRFGPPWMP